MSRKPLILSTSTHVHDGTLLPNNDASDTILTEVADNKSHLAFVGG